jgi:transcriptional antiterminator
MTRAGLDQLATVQDLHNLYRKISDDIRALMEQNKKEFCTPKEFSEKTGIKHRTILNYCNSGKIKATQKVAGGSWTIHYSELERFISDAEENRYDI